MPHNKFGEALRGFRRRAGKTQEDLATAIGVDFTYISKIENGKAPPPRRDKIERAAGFLELSDQEEIELLLLAEKFPSDVQDWALEQPKAVGLYRSIQKVAPDEQEKMLDELIERVREKLDEQGSE
jgi:transcriptional regulator with XRE-family HTH domain